MLVRCSPIRGFQDSKPRETGAALTLILGGLIITVNVGLEMQAAVFVYPRREVDDVHGTFCLSFTWRSVPARIAAKIDGSSHSG